MKNVSLLLFIMVSCFANAQSILIKNISIVDVEQGKINPAQSVLITDKRIKSIGKKITAEKNTIVVDGSGKFLLPGLWDMHVHAVGSYKSMLPLFLAYGVTGVREMGTEFVDTMVYLRKMIAKEEMIGPTIYGTGPVLDGTPTILKPGLDIGLRSQAEAEHVVDSIAAKGVDFLKVYEMLTPELFQAVANSARKKNLSFVGHLPIQVDLATAINAGMKSIEHMVGLETAFTSKADSIRQIEIGMIKSFTGSNGLQLLGSLRRKRFAEAYEYFDQQKANELCALLKSKTVYVTPTLIVLLRFARRDDLAAQKDGADKYIDPQTKNGWNRQFENLLKDTSFAVSEKRLQYILKIARTLHDNHVNLLAGTDTPNSWVIPGFGLHREFEYLSEAGLSNAEILRTATINPAKFMNKEKETGSIGIGKNADLVILDADPLQQISNTKRIDAVIVKGKLFTKTDLAHLKESALVQ